MCLARSQKVPLVPGQHVESRVARSGNGFVEDLRPPCRDLSNVCVGHRLQVDDVKVIHALAVAEVLTRECSVVQQRLVGRVRTVDEQRSIALVGRDAASGEDCRENATPLCVRPLASVVRVPPSCTCQLLNDCRSAPAGPVAATSAKHAAAPRPASDFICLLICHSSLRKSSFCGSTERVIRSVVSPARRAAAATCSTDAASKKWRQVSSSAR